MAVDTICTPTTCTHHQHCSQNCVCWGLELVDVRYRSYQSCSVGTYRRHQVSDVQGSVHIIHVHVCNNLCTYSWMMCKEIAKDPVYIVPVWGL